MLTDGPYLDRKERPWLTCAALCVFGLGLVVRIFYWREIPAGVAYEIDAAYRALTGQCPYVDFYFDQAPPAIWLRMPAVLTAPLIALLQFKSPDLSACLAHINIIGLASVLNVVALSAASFTLAYRILKSFGETVFAPHIRSLLLLSMAVGNLAMSFEYGNQQHIFVLLFLPYFFTRWIEMQGGKTSGPLPLIAALPAAFGAALSPLYTAAFLLLESVEVLARRNLRSLSSKTLWIFVAAAVCVWLNLLLLPKGAAAALYGWILPLKFNSLTHDSYTFYGLTSTPECRSLVYFFVMAAIFAGGGLRYFTFFRPLVTMAAYGFAVWLTLVSGLSADGLILKYFNAMLLTMQVYFAVNWLARSYPRLFFRRVNLAWRVLVLGSCLLCCSAFLASESKQRQLVKTGQERLHPVNYKDLQELATAIGKNSNEGDRVLLINGKMRPAYSLLMQLDRKPCGFFMGTEALGTLSDIRTMNHFDNERGLTRSMIEALESRLYKRLEDDINSQKPELICVEQGDVDTAFQSFGVRALVEKSYETIREASYFSDHKGTREISDFNYNYTIYKLKKPESNK